MSMIQEGIFELIISPESPDYLYCIDERTLLPDPFSRWQPFGVHGPSRIYGSDFTWTDQSWKGIPLSTFIVYELHVGTFTSEGTFEAVIEKLPYLRSLGITAVELMPVIEFPGSRNWGYDGVYPYAPHHLYGGPDGLKRLIDACHAHGLAVILDVVYNHLGPEGNYLGQFGPYFTDRYPTPWGQAVNYDGSGSEHVRRFVMDNALFWLTEYHVDALRLDAIHAIFDFSARHILEEMGQEFHKQSHALGRQAFLLLESDLNDVRVLKPVPEGYGADAQWSDDFHHALHALIAPTKWEYFADFGKMEHLVKSLTEGFAYQGQFSNYRQMQFGSSSKDLPGEQFIVCIQNHDQVGNAGQGKRLGAFVTADQYKLATLLLFCAPNIPLLFMGQEWNAEAPFYYFTSFEDEALSGSVREGYQNEFKLNEAVDPQDLKRFEASKLPWHQLEEPQHNQMVEFYRHVIHLRKTVPCLCNCRKDLTAVRFSEEDRWLILERSDPGGSKMVLAANFSDQARLIPTPFASGSWQNGFVQEELLFQADAEHPLQVSPWSALLFIQLLERLEYL